MKKNFECSNRVEKCYISTVRLLLHKVISDIKKKAERDTNVRPHFLKNISVLILPFNFIATERLFHCMNALSSISSSI